MRDDKIYNYTCMIKLKFSIKFSRSVHENVPNPLAGLSPPAVGELSSTSNSFRHSKRFPKLCVSGTAIVEDHEIKGAWHSAKFVAKVEVQRSILVVVKEEQNDFHVEAIPKSVRVREGLR